MNAHEVSNGLLGFFYLTQSNSKLLDELLIRDVSIRKMKHGVKHGVAVAALLIGKVEMKIVATCKVAKIMLHHHSGTRLLVQHPVEAGVPSFGGEALESIRLELKRVVLGCLAAVGDMLMLKTKVNKNALLGSAGKSGGHGGGIGVGGHGVKFNFLE